MNGDFAEQLEQLGEGIGMNPQTATCIATIVVALLSIALMYFRNNASITNFKATRLTLASREKKVVTHVNNLEKQRLSRETDSQKLVSGMCRELSECERFSDAKLIFAKYEALSLERENRLEARAKEIGEEADRLEDEFSTLPVKKIKKKRRE